MLKKHRRTFFDLLEPSLYVRLQVNLILEVNANLYAEPSMLFCIFPVQHSTGVGGIQLNGKYIFFFFYLFSSCISLIFFPSFLSLQLLLLARIKPRFNLRFPRSTPPNLDWIKTLHWCVPPVARCTLDCVHGVCDAGVCACEEGWMGPRCEERGCDQRCALHGQCHNGTCLCVQGWNGRHCTIRES